MPVSRSLLAERAACQRSKVSNRKRLLPGTDGRSAEQRRWRDIVFALSRELGVEPSEGQLAIIKTVASVTVASELIQSRVVMGTATAAEIGELSRLANAQMRGLFSLGLKRSKHATGPTLAEYLAQKAEAEGKL